MQVTKWVGVLDLDYRSTLCFMQRLSDISHMSTMTHDQTEQTEESDPQSV